HARSIGPIPQGFAALVALSSKGGEDPHHEPSGKLAKRWGRRSGQRRNGCGDRRSRRRIMRVRLTGVDLPAHIAERIRAVVASTSKEGGHVDSEAARYGGVALMGTIGATWLLRPDGTIWDVDDDFGRPIAPLAPEWHHAAIRCGTQRYPWLADLIPSRPPTA